MEWLQGFEQTGDVLMANIARAGAEPELVGVRHLNLRGVPFVSGLWPAAQVITDFLDWGECDPREYLAHVPELKVNGSNHAVYRFDFDGIRYLVPALVLNRALFVLPGDLREELFSPRPLELLCTPETDGHYWDITLDRNAKNISSKRTMKCLKWAMLFPSGRKAWHSVLQFAKQDQVRVALPNARVLARAVGPRAEGTMYVQRLWLDALEALEAPFEFAPTANRQLPIHLGCGAVADFFRRGALPRTKWRRR